MLLDQSEAVTKLKEHNDLSLKKEETTPKDGANSSLSAPAGASLAPGGAAPTLTPQQQAQQRQVRRFRLR